MVSGRIRHLIEERSLSRPFPFQGTLSIFMDNQKSPDQHIPPDHDQQLQENNISLSLDSNNRNPANPDNDMATLVAHNHPQNMPGSSQQQSQQSQGINKRYRPAPAKTFQCRGYGECRMVFSRSEHLARHIRSVSQKKNLSSLQPSCRG